MLPFVEALFKLMIQISYIYIKRVMRTNEVLLNFVSRVNQPIFLFLQKSL